MTPLDLQSYCYANGLPLWQPSTAGAPGASPPPSAIPVVNVAEYVALYGPSPSPAEVREAIRKAAEDVPDGGGVLHFPPGEYAIDNQACLPIAIKSGTWVRGAGRATILRSASPSGAALLHLHGVRDVRVSDIVFDIDHGVCAPAGSPASVSNNFKTAISCGSGQDLVTHEVFGAGNITIEGCVFMTSGDAVRGQTLHAVLARGVDGLYIRDNHVLGLQIKAAGAEGATRVFIDDNFIDDPHNMAISVVMQKLDEATYSAVVDLRIAGNIIENVASAGGLFIGTDGEGTAGDELHRVIVRGNVIRGSFPGHQSGLPCLDALPAGAPGKLDAVGAAAAMILDVPVSGLDILIEDNVVENTVAVSDIADNTSGIVLNYSNRATTFLGSVVISGNTVRNFDQAGITVSCAARSLLIAGNYIEHARGIRVNTGPAGTDQLVIAHNIIRQLQGIWIDATAGAIERGLVHGNVIACAAREPAHEVFFAGITLVAGGSETRISADVRRNLLLSSAGVGIRELGEPNSLGPIRYLDNHLPTAPASPFDLRSAASTRRRNRGDTTSSQGTGSIPGLAGAVVVHHGLSGTPDRAHIRITGTAPPPASWTAGGLPWVSDADATTFTVRCGKPLPGGQSFPFAWQAWLA